MKEKTQPNQSRKPNIIWKVIAIIFIAIFALFLIWGFIRANHFKASFARPTQDQSDYAIKVAKEKMDSLGIDSSLLQSRASDRMPKPRGEKDRKVLQVSFFNDTTTHSFLVDLDTGEAILHSQTEIFIDARPDFRGEHDKGMGFAFMPFAKPIERDMPGFDR